MKAYTKQDIENYLESLNERYYGIHKRYENYFWASYMGDSSVDEKMSDALAKKNAFAGNDKALTTVREMISCASDKQKRRLQYWEEYFSVSQIPEHVLELRTNISKLENAIAAKRNNRKEGYIDPKSKKFIDAPLNQMRMIQATHSDEKIRKAVFRASEELAPEFIDEYINLVQMRNQFARKLGYENFYAYKLDIEEGMTTKELFQLFDDIYNKTRFGFKNVRKMEKNMPGLRKPWNYGYMLAGDFTQEEDQYFPLDEMLERWGLSFSRCGIDYAGGALRLDLLERKGKYNNGFCHWPKVIRYKNGVREPGEARFTCNAVYGQVGSGNRAGVTLFHEGGHAAHLLNSKQTETCLNHEYPPTSTAWAETQSMFLDTMFSSIEWKTKYAKNKKGESFPLDLFKRKLEKTFETRPLGIIMGISAVMYFEKEIYETSKLTKAKVKEIAKRVYGKYTDYSEDSLRLLNIPHIYSFESSCSYHGYGLATIALTQWRDYFYKKYGQIVDNKAVGKEMKEVWALASSKKFPELVQIATGKKLSAQPYINTVLLSKKQILLRSRRRIKTLEQNPSRVKRINLKADISLWHGKKKVSDNRSGFDTMVARYAKWLETQKI